jgi:type IV pilus assembly protein PilQ
MRELIVEREGIKLDVISTGRDAQEIADFGFEISDLRSQIAARPKPSHSAICHPKSPAQEFSMSRSSRIVRTLFLAAASVYAGQGFLTNPAKAAKPLPTPSDNTKPDVRMLDEGTDPFAGAPANPTTNPTDTDGTSVSDSQVAVTDTGNVEIHVNDASLVEVLRMLSLQSQRNIIASKEVGGKVTANLYGVTVREALDAILHANGYAYREKGNFIYVYTAKEIAEIEKAERQPTTELFRLYYTPAENAVTMIKPVMSEAGQVAFSTPPTKGIESSQTEAGGNTHATEDVIVVTDYPDNIEKVRKVLKEVDRRPQQILLEATIVRASLNEDNALGIDFTVMGGVDFAGISNSGSSTGAALNGNILNQASASAIVDKGYGGAGTGFTGSVPNGGLKVGVVSNNIAVFLSALESVTDTMILANPKVLALNKQRGEVIVGRKDGYLTTTVTESSSVQTVEFLDTGTRLIYRPYIGDDGYIRMEIHPEDSSGGLQGSSNLPFKITTEVTSNVMVKDGHTVVIGGLFRESSTSARGQVPGLGNLPMAGWMFRNQRDQTTREEIIILLTPHIVKDDASYSKYSEDQLKEADKLRVGTRNGMMPFGRERLAESCYEKARAEMDKPNPDKQKALWHVNCAMNLNPKFSEAVRLKEEITGKVVAASDNSTIRHFLTKQVLQEKEHPVVYEVAPRSIAITPPARKEQNPPATQASDQRAETPTTQPANLAQASSPGEVKSGERKGVLSSVWSNWLDVSNYYMGGTQQPAQKGSESTFTELPMEESNGK